MGIANFDSKKVIAQIQANNERKKYFDGMGINVQNAKNLETAIALSGLNFEVEKRPLYTMNDIVSNIGGKEVVIQQPQLFKNQFATVRSDNNSHLGVVGKNYNILQNREAFDFLDCIGNDIKYETAGTYGPNSAKSFITISTEPIKICGDDFMPYICLLNSFDGSCSIKAFFTSIRVFCSNTLVRAMQNSENKISIRHSSNLQERMKNAREMLLANSNYLNELKKEADKLATVPFSREAFEALARSLYPVNKDDKEFIQIRNLEQITHLLEAYNQQDLNNFRETAWGAIQAVADAESHSLNFKKTTNPAKKNFDTVITLGMPLLNHVYDMMMERAAA